MNPFKYALLLCCFLPNIAHSQLYNDGSILKIGADVTVSCFGTVTNAAGGTFTNDGKLVASNTLTNMSTAVLSGNGSYVIGGDFANTGTFNAGTSSVTLTDAAAATIRSNGSPFNQLNIAKLAGVGEVVTIADVLTINKSLDFSSPSAKILMGASDVIFGTTASVTGYKSTSYLTTNGLGKVVKKSLGTTPFTFPVSNGITYNPVTIAQSGTTEDISVRCLDKVYRNGTTGAVATVGVVNASWVITESAVGNNNASITTEWVGTNEMLSFNRTSCRISRYNGTTWSTDNLGASAGANPYTRTQTFTGDLNGTYAVNSSSLTGVADAAQSGWQIGTVYPNPLSISGGLVRLSLTSPVKTTAQWALVDNLGRTIHAFAKEIDQGQNDLSIDIPALAVGVYHVKINVAGQFIAQKLVIQ
jgi:adhesin HecA-like repeat protein